MKTYQVSMWMVGAVVVLLAGSSASEAGRLRGGGRCYYYPAESTYSVATSPATAPAARLPRPGLRGRRSIRSTNQWTGRIRCPRRTRRRTQAGRRRIERNAAKLMGFRQFSTLSVMAVKSRCLEV